MQPIQRLIQARKIVEHIIQGEDPATGEKLTRESFLDSPELVRGLSYVLGTITEQIERTKGRSQDTRKPFDITTEQLAKVMLPDYKIGVNELAKCINKVVDLSVTKGITGAQINAKLKEEGILSEAIDEEGKRRTIINKNSKTYGLEHVPVIFNGRQYDKVVFNNKGKSWILQKFVHIMKLEEVAAIDENHINKGSKKIKE